MGGESGATKWHSNHMKNTMKIVVIGALAALGLAHNNALASTNVVLQVNVALTGFGQASDSNAAPVKITTKDVITALNAVQVGGSNVFSFASNAKLLVVSGGDQNGPSFWVREKQGTNVINTSVNDYISATGSDDVRAHGIRYSILTFRFDNGQGTDFNVDGFATMRRGKVSAPRIGTLDNQTIGVTAGVAGTGDVAGEYSIFRGTITATAPKAEVED